MRSGCEGDTELNAVVQALKPGRNPVYRSAANSQKSVVDLSALSFFFQSLSFLDAFPVTLSRKLQALPWYRQPSMLLLVALTLTLVLYPFSDEVRAMRFLVQVLDITVVLVAVRIVRAHAMFWRGGWIIAVPLVLLQLWHLLLPSRPVDLGLLCAQVLFHGYAVIMLLNYVMRDEVITLDELFALAGVYVLLSLLWASAYGIVVWFNADAIFINPTNNPKNYVSFPDLVYFSLTTLSSTGYGEITPVSPAARALAMLQQWFGVLFVAMVIARMTSLYDRRPKG